MLAFTLTIHKAQGLSVKTAIVDAGSTCFGSGMVYVALSGVTTLSGLHLIELDRSKIVCDKKAVTEYNRLRQRYTPHLGNSITVQPTDSNTDVPESDSSSNFDHTPLHNSHDSTQNTGGQLAIRNFNCCEIVSLNEESQSAICDRLNLLLFPAEDAPMSRSNSIVSKKAATAHLHQHKHRNRHQNKTTHQVMVTVYLGPWHTKCAEARALTTFFRQYVVNHMTHPQIEHKLQQLFTGETHNSHLLRMQEPGCWGTEQEIATVAHLLQCSIICFSKYNSNNQYCMQHFPPHFIDRAECTNLCCHKRIYLINNNGVHYDAAVVTYRNTSTVKKIVQKNSKIPKT